VIVGFVRRLRAFEANLRASPSMNHRAVSASNARACILSFCSRTTRVSSQIYKSPPCKCSRSPSLSLSLSLSFFLARQRVRCSKISRNPPERATFVRRKRTFRMIHPIKMTVQRERKWKVTRPVIPRPFLPLFFRGNVMRASTFPSLRVTRNDHRKWIM